MMNENCKCPRAKCERHGNCGSCQAFHSDPDKVISFCKWAEIAGFSEPESRSGLKAWLSNDRDSFDAGKWLKRKV
jgi:hypothetical protein